MSDAMEYCEHRILIGETCVRCLRAQLAAVTAERDALKVLLAGSVRDAVTVAWSYRRVLQARDVEFLESARREIDAALSPAQTKPSCVCGHPEESHPSEYQRVTPRLAGKCARCECTRFR